jgi:hypothetical protein
MLGKCIGFEIRDLAVSVETSQDFSCHSAEVLLLMHLLDAQNLEC